MKTGLNPVLLAKHGDRFNLGANLVELLLNLSKPSVVKISEFGGTESLSPKPS